MFPEAFAASSSTWPRFQPVFVFDRAISATGSAEASTQKQIKSKVEKHTSWQTRFAEGRATSQIVAKRKILGYWQGSGSNGIEDEIVSKRLLSVEIRALFARALRELLVAILVDLGASV